MRGINTITSLRGSAASHAFAQNLHRGQYQPAADHIARERVGIALAELAECLRALCPDTAQAAVLPSKRSALRRPSIANAERG
jgi:hypothetical protein